MTNPTFPQVLQLRSLDCCICFSICLCPLLSCRVTNPRQVRAIDAFDPQDFAIPWIRQGGTTAAQVMPGSGNVMGGEAVHVKYRISTTVQDLLLLGGPPAEKMATGENPKHVYGPMVLSNDKHELTDSVGANADDTHGHSVAPTSKV